MKTFVSLSLLFCLLTTPLTLQAQPQPAIEYLWYEAENMRGFSTGKLGEPLLNPSHLNLSKDKAPGWGMNGPGVSAEWTQGGESEWNSAAASADETRATLHQDIEVSRAGEYKFWVRYADWANRTENFTVRIAQGNSFVFKHEFGVRDLIDPHDEVSLYWQWAFAWDSATTTLKKGPARVSIEIDKAAGARRHIDCFVLTNDIVYKPSGRQKPDFAAQRYLREWISTRTPLKSLIASLADETVPPSWTRPAVTGRDFFMPWNINTAFWALSDKPVEQRPLYPFHTESVDAFVEKYKGVRDVPIFQSKLVVPVIYINNLPEYLKEGSAFVRYLRETKAPFAILINYGSAAMPAPEAQAVWNLLNGEFKDQFLGWISGESVGYVWDFAPAELKISPSMDRRQLLEAHRVFYTNALTRKWQSLFHSQTGPMWEKLWPAQSTSSTSFAHALSEWGVKLLGMETAAVQPMTAMRIAFTRGAARQFGGAFFYYHAPNFGDTATTFTTTQNFAGPDFFYHSRYGPTMGPSLSWYRKSYYLYYMAGASAIYLEQGFDQFFRPGPGQNPLQLNPLGRITDEFMRFAEKHRDRGTPYTPVAFLLDPAHGFEMTDYPHWPFEVSQISKSDRALRELFGVAYYPGLVVEGEPAIADRQPFASGPFGDIFDVLVTSDGQVSTPSMTSGNSGSSRSQDSTLSSYKALVVGGDVTWSPSWVQRLTTYVRNGGTVVLNVAQRGGLSQEFLGVNVTNEPGEADSASCTFAQNEHPTHLNGQVFRYQKLALKGPNTSALISTSNGDPLVTVNRLGKGTVVFSGLPHLLGQDERITPFAAHMLAHVFADATPVSVRGDVEYLINRTAGSWIVTLLNNNGVFKPQQGMAQVDRTAFVNVKIGVRGKPIESAVDWVTDKPIEVRRDGGDQLLVNIPPGGVAIVEIRTRQ